MTRVHIPLSKEESHELLWVVILILLATIGICSLESAYGAEGKRRAVDPSFPAYKDLQLACWMYAEPSTAKAFDTVNAYGQTHELPVSVREALSTVEREKYLIAFLHANDCNPSDGLELMSAEQARDLREAYSLILSAAQIIGTR